MKIEIGKAYAVSNKYKKSVLEVIQYQHDDGRGITQELLWRSGLIFVTPTSEEEVELLRAARDEEVEISTDQLSEWEFHSTDDGCYQSFESDDVDIEELESQFEELEESGESDYYSFDEYIEEGLGFWLDDSTLNFQSGIDIEEKE